MKFANDKGERNVGIALIVIFIWILLGAIFGRSDVGDDSGDDGVTIGDKYYSAEEVQKAREYGYDYVSGKPVDMTDEEWEYVNRRLLQEDVNSRKDRHDAARAIWRQERYIRKQLE